MKPIAAVGIVLIVLGLLALVYQGITYRTRETVLDVGPIHATAERDRTIIAGVAGGVVLLITGIRKHA